MPPMSSRLDEEGAVLRALCVVDGGVFRSQPLVDALTAGPHPARNVSDNVADIEAQIAANQAGARLLGELVASQGLETVSAYMRHIQDNAAARVAAEIARLPDGAYARTDALDDGTVIAAAIEVTGDRMTIDLRGSGPATATNLNAPRSVAVSAVIYVLRALVGTRIPLNSGCLRNVEILLEPGSVLDPPAGAAVAGGNVETSQRLVDVLLGALGLAAASQGTMNNLTFGTERFGYYETIAGGAGATPRRAGASGVHTHMTNTRITDPEVLEARFPVRVVQFGIRRGSGGAGKRRGGDGVIRELEMLEPMRVSILSERRVLAPFGLEGGASGQRGRNFCGDRDVGGKAVFDVEAGERVRIETPGGGGHGAPD
jgi:5-oxoprolinase (ATP-hydrolysing)